MTLPALLPSISVRKAGLPNFWNRLAPRREKWTYEDRREFDSVFFHFRKAFEAKDGDKLPITLGDAFLAYITVFGYRETTQKTEQEIKKDLSKIWDEFLVLTNDQSIELFMEPPKKEVSHNLYRNLLNLVLPDNVNRAKIAFLYEKDHRTSSWTYSHELGRLYLDNVFPGQIETKAFDNIIAGENDLERMEQAVKDGYNVLFATSPVMIPASLKIAANCPDVKILNCSLNTSHPTLRTYYARMYEAVPGWRHSGIHDRYKQDRVHCRLSDLWYGRQYQCLCPGSQVGESTCEGLFGLEYFEGAEGRYFGGFGDRLYYGSGYDNA